jgi:hypothetical protein
MIYHFARRAELAERGIKISCDVALLQARRHQFQKAGARNAFIKISRQMTREPIIQPTCGGCHFALGFSDQRLRRNFIQDPLSKCLDWTAIGVRFEPGQTV